MKVLVLDIGGSKVKARVTGSEDVRSFETGQQFTPEQLVEGVHRVAGDWEYDVISVGYPGTVGADGPLKEPGNLGPGWIGFDFEKAFKVPVRVVNDASLQALGGYQGGRMLFLGLGTGLGSALVTEHVVVPMELGNIVFRTGETLGKLLGKKGLEAHGHRRWLKVITETLPMLRRALAADYTLLGGGNAKLVDPLPSRTRRGSNHDAFVGGLKLWEEIVEPHDRRSPAVWRVVQ